MNFRNKNLKKSQIYYLKYFNIKDLKLWLNKYLYDFKDIWVLKLLEIIQYCKLFNFKYYYSNNHQWSKLILKKKNKNYFNREIKSQKSK
jgi:hypothetical protein